MKKKSVIRALAALAALSASAAWAGPFDQQLPVASVRASEMSFPRRISDLCETCEVQLGIGGTYHAWQNTGGVVIPLTVTWDRSRYEFGLFRFAHDQISAERESLGHELAAPYWGASLSRRWKLIGYGPVNAYFGFGVSYKTEENVLSATPWNFAEQLAVRVSPESIPAVFEFSVRHWSNGGVKAPNRGQDFAMMTVRFER